MSVGTLPLVSVLIPCYNAGPYVGETLESVFSQTWGNIEVVIVNDGSVDNSIDIIHRLKRPNLVVVDRGNRGAAASRNEALRVSTGDYIQWLDADDLLSPDKISTQMRRLMGRQSHVACCEWARFVDNPATAVFQPDATWEDLEPCDWLARGRADGHRMMFPAMWLAHRSLVDAAGPWNEALTLNDDTEYFTRLLLASGGVAFCPGAKAYYRSEIPGSLSKSKSRAAWQSAYWCQVLCDKHILEREDSPRMRRASSLAWQEYAHNVYPYDSVLGELASSMAATMDRRVTRKLDGGWKLKALSGILGWRRARLIQHRLRG